MKDKEFLEEISKLKKIIGYTPKYSIGEGAWGIAFITKENKNLVMKITAHYREAKMAASVIKLRKSGIKLPGIVGIKKVIHIKSRNLRKYYLFTGTKNIFIIIREFVEGCPAEEKYRKLGCIYSGRNKNLVKEYWNEFPEICKTAETLRKKGIIIWDIKRDNAGLKDKKVKLFDFSYSAIGKQEKISIPSYSV